MKNIILISFLFLCIAQPAYAELPEGLRVNGRIFYAGGYSFERPYFDENIFAESNLRFNGRYRINSEMKLEFAWQVDGVYYPGISSSASGDNGLMNLSWEIDSGRNWGVSHGFDRLALNYRGDDFTLDLGRQRLAWGTTMIMSFMDMFHPIQPGNPFVPEQPGTDAVRVQVPSGPVSGYDILYAWFDDEGTEAVAAKYHDVHGDFESAVSVGRIRGENFAAIETSGDIHDIGLRIEAGWFDTEIGNPWKLAIESDWAPNDKTYVSGEIFYNGRGATSEENYDQELFARGELYPARWYTGLTLSHNDGGLSTFGLFGLYNITDDSWFADFSVSTSLSNASDLRIGFQHYEGGSMTEYGALPDIIYIMNSRYF